MQTAQTAALAATPSQPVQAGVPYKQMVTAQADPSPEPVQGLPAAASAESVPPSPAFQVLSRNQTAQYTANEIAPLTPSEDKPKTSDSSKDHPIQAAQPATYSVAQQTNDSAAVNLNTAQSQAAETEFVPVRTTPGGESQLQRVTGPQSAPPASQDKTVNAQSGSVKPNGDTEAFRFDLHPAPESPASSNSDSGSQRSQASEQAPVPMDREPDPSQTRESSENTAPSEAGSSATASNAAIDQPATAKHAQTNVSMQAKTPVSVQPDQPAEKTQNAAPQAGSQAPDAAAQSSGQQGILSIATTRNADPKSGPAVSSRPAESAEPIDGTRPGTANQMTVRVEGDAGQVINVRFVNQGDQVQVAVRSNDPSAAAQLRHGLPSLTDDLGRVGWKADVSAVSAALHDASRSENDSRGSDKGSVLDWEQESPKKKFQASELWEELRDQQDA